MKKLINNLKKEQINQSLVALIDETVNDAILHEIVMNQLVISQLGN